MNQATESADQASPPDVVPNNAAASSQVEVEVVLLKNVLDKGYCCWVTTWDHGQQLNAKLCFGMSGTQFKGTKTLQSMNLESNQGHKKYNFLFILLLLFK